MPGCSRGFPLKSSITYLTVLDLPEPDPALLEWISPSLANDLLECGYRVAWRLDPNFGRFVGRALIQAGLVAHAVMEDAGNRLFAGLEDEAEARQAVEGAWMLHLASASTELAVAWKPAIPPPPEDWPGYHLTKARITRRAMRRHQKAGLSDGGWAPPLIEKMLEDAANRLFGRPDRVEGPKGDRRVVDLKTGLAQAEASPSQKRQLLLYAHLVQSSAGEHVTHVAIEDASGRRWEQPFDEQELVRLLQEIDARRSAFESARSIGALSAIASPSEDTCRWCPYRIKCSPYWSSLDSSWRHGSVAGSVERVTDGPHGSILEISGQSPVDWGGLAWIVSLVPDSIGHLEGDVAIVDAEVTGADRFLRWRWSTIASQI